MMVFVVETKGFFSLQQNVSIKFGESLITYKEFRKSKTTLIMRFKYYSQNPEGSILLSVRPVLRGYSVVWENQISNLSLYRALSSLVFWALLLSDLSFSRDTFG